MTDDPLAALRQTPVPPDDLEARVVTAVTEAGGIRPARPGRSWLWRLAASIMLFGAGVTAGLQWPTTTPAAAEAGPRWMLLLGGDVTPAADGSTRADEYGAWMRDLMGRGVVITGAELADDGRLVRGNDGERLAPLAGVGGYFIVQAPTQADALTIAESCPHARYGGTIAVHRLME